VPGPTISYLIQEGYLVEPITYGPIHKLDLSGIASKMGDYDLRQLAVHMDDPHITADAISQYARICPGVPAVAFCVNIKHAENVTAAFCAAGFRAALVHGKLDITTIRARISGLTDGSVQILVAVDLISEGTDIPAVVCAINLRATKSKGLHIQQGGRALRPVYASGFDLSTKEGRLAAIAASSKPKAIILDHAANCLRHMTVDEPHEWTLEGRKKRAGGGGVLVPQRQCPKCFQMSKPSPRCPRFNPDGTPCGYIYVVETELPTTVSGELVPIDKAALRRAKWKEERACKTLGELQDLGRKRGFRPGWAWHKWQARGTAVPAGESFFEQGN
jgi:superfamily II DNA or RNA helicase